MEDGGPPAEKLMDDFFRSVGLQRKKVAKDGSCLFRAVAEQVLLCQSLHTQVRARCVQFLKDNRGHYEAFIEGDFEDYLCKIQDPQHWVGEVEINALAVIYKRDFMIFQEPGKPAVNITANRFKDQVQLCFLNGNHYDSVYPVGHIQNTAFCQSLLYELLYERVFREERSVLASAQRGGRSSELTDDHMTACPSSDESETEDPIWWEPGRGRGRGRGRGLSERLRRSLNPTLLRNVDYDVWLTSKRVQQKMDFCMAAGMQYSEGDRCQVCLEGGGRSYSGSIRKVSPSNGPVTVFIEELGRHHPDHPPPPPTTWLASLKAPLPNQNTTFTSISHPPAVAPPTATVSTAEQRTPSPLLLTTTSSSSAPIFIAPVAPPPGGAHFYLPHTSSAPSSYLSAPPRSSSSSSSSRSDGPAPGEVSVSPVQELMDRWIDITVNPVPQDPINQPSLPKNLMPSVTQNLLPSVAQQSGSHPTLPQPCVPQNPLHPNPVSQSSVPQPYVHQPSVPQPSVSQHPVPQHPEPQHPEPQLSGPQHPVPQPSGPQHPLPKHPVPQPSEPQHPEPQHPVPQPSVPQHPEHQPSVPQHPVPQYPEHQPSPSVPQHPVHQPSVPQHPEPQPPVPQHPEPQPSVPQYPEPQPSVPQGCWGTGCHLQPPPAPFTPSPLPEPSQGAVPLQQLSQLYQDPLYPGFPVGSAGDMLPTPDYSSNKTGDDLPHDVNVLRWFFNLGVKAYSNPMFPPYMYLLPLQQHTHTMHPPPLAPIPPRDPTPVLWQQSATPPPGHPSSGPGYPGASSPALQLSGPGPRHPELEGYRATGANRANWVSEPKFQDTMVAMTTAPHGNCPTTALYGPVTNTPNSDPHGNHYHGYRANYHSPAGAYAHMGAGPSVGLGMEAWKGPESGSSNQRGRRGYPQRGGGGERRGRGNRRGYGARGVGPNYSQYSPTPRTRDQGYY
ncbi:unnamed protein product [Merluccius merluccius]